MFKKFILSVLILLLASVLFGSVSATNLDPANPVVISFWNSAEGGWASTLQNLIDEFNSTIGAKRGVIVESTYVGGDVAAKLKELAQANDWENFPDAGQIYSAGIPTIVQWDNLLKIDDMFNRGYDVITRKEDILPSMIRTYTYSGEMVAMPLNSSTLLLYYNKTLADAAGLDTANGPETIEELANWTAALTEFNDDGSVARYGLNLQVDRYELVNFLSGISETGCNYFGDNGGGRDGMMTRLTIGDDGSLEKFLTEWEKVIATGGYKPVNDDERGEFGSQLSAMNFQSSAQMNTMMNKAKENGFELGIAKIQKCTADDYFGSCVGGGSISMFDKGEEAKIEGTWLFLQYMASAETQLKICAETGYLPVNAETYQLQAWDELSKEKPGLLVAMDALNEANPDMQEPFEILNTDLNQLVQKSLIDFANGEMDKAAVISNICDNFNEKLEEYIDANY